MRSAFLFIAVGILTYLSICVLLYFSQRNLMYSPSLGEISPSDFGLPEMKPVSFKTEDGVSLLAWYKPPDYKKNLTLLYLHGNAGHIGHRSSKVRPYIEQGYGVLLLSYRGYGPNVGSPSEKNLYLDGKSALQFLNDENIPASKVVLYGESLGSGIAVELAQYSRFAALILEAPFTSMVDVASHHYGIFPVNLLILDKYTSINKLQNVTSKLLVIHGKKDRTVPFELGHQLFESATGNKTFYKFSEAKHNDLYEFGAAKRIIHFLDTIGVN